MTTLIVCDSPGSCLVRRRERCVYVCSAGSFCMFARLCVCVCALVSMCMWMPARKYTCMRVHRNNLNSHFQPHLIGEMSLCSHCLLLQMKLIMEHGSGLLTPLCKTDTWLCLSRALSSPQRWAPVRQPQLYLGLSDCCSCYRGPKGHWSV